MFNPYKVLNVSQDATKAEIHAAQMRAMKTIKTNGIELKDIQQAARQLLDPAKRLAADFMYPTRIRSKRPQKITISIAIQAININDINPNALNSLK